MNIMLRAEAQDFGKRLDWFVHERLPEYSRARLQGWIKTGRVRVNGAAARPSHTLRVGEEIEVEPGSLPPLRAEPEEIPLTILYEDADVIAIDKPAGMVVHAGAGHHRGTLVNALLHHFGQLSTTGGDLRPGIVHRLDRETSGVLIVARTDQAHQSLAEQFRARKVEKTYLALARGHISPPQGTITKRIMRDPVRRTRMTTRLESGRTALTHYRTIEQLANLSLLEVKIGTGRTHQIRVHLSSIGHPIVGDGLYGAPRRADRIPAPDRFFLHAQRLRFQSPSTGQPIEIESPLAPELKDYLERLRALNCDGG
ncbi:MAG TPA: RluA family pseudouridine synthase [Bryobacteraceae bacterium]|jgi:23S rRNA pseudouridine1911/1915/1917 synthase|nr:RluA family pseudouridine synthase [Bryobacteraceae bacterium]